MIFSWNTPSHVRPVVTHMFVFVAGMAVLAGIHQMRAGIYPCQLSYNLLNPSIRCNDVIVRGELDYEPMRAALSDAKARLKEEGKVSHLSVYFRDLRYGPRFGIGEYDKFQPASLLKVPVMIAFLHHADADPSILDKKLSYTEPLDVNENVEEASETIEPFKPYTIRQLIAKMIVYSDNYSYKLLMEEINEQPLIAYFTFRDLDVLKMMTTPNADYISINSYGNLFGALYNTGYLSKDHSQYALELLSQATFKHGLVAGVPEGTVVAHKFGRRVLANEDDQLHDCGLIYHPQTDYVLCVMTSGTNYEHQKNAIAEISSIVFNAIEVQHQ